MNPFRFKLVRPVAVAIFIGLVSTQPSFCGSYSLINIDPSTQYTFNESHANAMIGYTFYLQQAITITQVGWYDEEQDGLSRDFQVGLWQDLNGATGWAYINPNNSVQLLGDPDFGLTIPAGTGTSLNGLWRVVDIAPLTLQPGGYELAGLDTANTPDVIKYALLHGYAPYDPPTLHLDIGAPIWSGNFGSEPPDFHVSSSFIAVYGLELGPMLFSNVPEPSTLALGGLSTAALLLFRRRRQN